MKANRIIIAILGFFILMSFGVFGIWGVNLAKGSFSRGLIVGSQEVSVPLLHLIAEALMAIVTLVGVYGYWFGRRWGKYILFFGLGMFVYSAINSFGWALSNDLMQGIPMMISLIVIVVSIPFLMKNKLN